LNVGRFLLPKTKNAQHFHTVSKLIRQSKYSECAGLPRFWLVERVVLNALAKNCRAAAGFSAFGDKSGIVFRRRRSTYAPGWNALANQHPGCLALLVQPRESASGQAHLRPPR
jgi:hypothetical protein